MSPEWEKLQNTLLPDFEKQAKKVGVVFAGTYNIYNSQNTITDPIFAYDLDSRMTLLELIIYKDSLGDLPYWRTLDGINVVLSLAQKNDLYDLLRYTYFTGLAEVNTGIDAI